MGRELGDWLLEGVFLPSPCALLKQKENSQQMEIPGSIRVIGPSVHGGMSHPARHDGTFTLSHPIPSVAFLAGCIEWTYLCIG